MSDKPKFMLKNKIKRKYYFNFNKNLIARIAISHLCICVCNILGIYVINKSHNLIVKEKFVCALFDFD